MGRPLRFTKELSLRYLGGVFPSGPAAHLRVASQRRTSYLWLCARCVRQLEPRIEVAGRSVTVRLSPRGRAPEAPRQVVQ